MRLSAAIEWLARALAIAGGIILVVITALTVISIVGRAMLTTAYLDTPSYLMWADGLFGLMRDGMRWLIDLRLPIGGWTFRIGPVPGDFELVEAFTAFAVFSFLPWCQIRRAHATVDVFTSFLPEKANRIIDLVTEVVMTLVIILIAWRLWHGMMDKVRYSETTFILQYPVWWGFAAAMFAAAIGVIVSLYMTWVRIRELSAPGATVHSSQEGAS
jgi:TRAP-type C4-dicarboxylate transport system permease small subunit